MDTINTSSETLDNEFESIEYIFFKVGECNFGIAAEKVMDVLEKQHITRVPLAPSCVIGMHNLRGRIVTCLDLKEILDISSPKTSTDDLIFMVFKFNNEIYSFAVDEILSITKLSYLDIQPAPANLADSWSAIATGIHNSDGAIKVIIDFALIFQIKGWDHEVI